MLPKKYSKTNACKPDTEDAPTVGEGGSTQVNRITLASSAGSPHSVRRDV